MQGKNKKAVEFIETLLDIEMVQDLELFDDQGVKVSTHTYDVLKISIDELKRDYRTFNEAKQKVEFFALTIGIIIHDLSKGSIRKQEEKLSHSQMMLKKPEYITKEAEKVLAEIEEKVGVQIKDDIRKNILHIVLSHHGKWGKIQPNTKEAHIVYRADMYSAKYHRINPIGADKILKLMTDGMQIDQICKELDCTQGVVKDRLKRAKQELKIKTTKQLLNYYKKNKKIPIGDNFFVQRVRETEKLKKLVDKRGFKNIMLQSPLINYMVDNEIFKEKADLSEV
ncbi:MULTISPECIES: HD domain-containing protein [Fusobacterium]|jgi:23S rRNA maturation-related 3'-5' exoribonuclease YhaM|uniref:HD domain-containing protein n=1 Tax=Fusobacterium hominis TaxID=2764326 RepID=A0A7G9GUP9_9FUSO|nr:MULTISPECIES: HD domain-containing protein [Fusobacterium]QNM14531.1 HD domain-containing protein [Fusobacterium hominis]